MSKSLEIAKKLLNTQVKVTIDRPLNTKHPKHGFVYLANYGYIEGVLAPDGEELDAYYLGISTPVNFAEGKVIAIIHRTNDDDDKLVVVPKNTTLTNEEIEKEVSFQEQWFDHEIIRS